MSRAIGTSEIVKKRAGPEGEHVTGVLFQFEVLTTCFDFARSRSPFGA